MSASAVLRTGSAGRNLVEAVGKTYADAEPLPLEGYQGVLSDEKQPQPWLTLDSERQQSQWGIAVPAPLPYRLKKSKAAQEKFSCACQHFLLCRACRQHTRNLNCSDHR